jgi:hypothetical protein
MFHRLFITLVIIAALHASPAAADDPACTVTALGVPCLLFPPGPSVADHSGMHDRDFFWILYNAYADEWNRLPPSDPNAAPSRRSIADMPPVPETSPPMPFTDWPIGGTQVIGGATPNSVDSR